MLVGRETEPVKRLIACVEVAERYHAAAPLQFRPDGRPAAGRAQEFDANLADPSPDAQLSPP
jgi:hypothetical protein